MKNGLIEENARIEKIRYQVFDTFDASGNPLYKNGTIDDERLLDDVKVSLQDAHESANAYSVTALGALVIFIQSAPSLTLKLIYNIRAEKYESMVYKETTLFLTTQKFASILDALRR